ncbi:MAG: YvcK family protein, partial [Candidatus Obscuribacterales bacterium]|nr:YvcK family protein [Candidatus Obscuribacterales bacterium]
RFASGQGLEGHSFGNLFLTALCEITHGDMLQAVKVASRVLNSRGQVLPSTLNSITLVAEMEDGRKVHGESHIAGANGHIKRMTCEPANPEPAPEAIDVIMNADLVVLGPGSLYTSIIPNMLVQGISEAIRQTAARRIYVCNVMTEAGETTNYTVGDHVEALLEHSSCDVGEGYKFVDAVLVNEDIPEEGSPDASPNFVTYDPNHVRDLGVRPIKRNVVSHNNPSQHDANQLAEALILWYTRRKRSKRRNGKAIPFRRRVASLF